MVACHGKVVSVSRQPLNSISWDSMPSGAPLAKRLTQTLMLKDIRDVT
jgi:hypothetical protein